LGWEGSVQAVISSVFSPICNTYDSQALRVSKTSTFKCYVSHKWSNAYPVNLSYMILQYLRKISVKGLDAFSLYSYIPGVNVKLHGVLNVISKSTVIIQVKVVPTIPSVLPFPTHLA
jgi:hypothetical protein